MRDQQGCTLSHEQLSWREQPFVTTYPARFEPQPTTEAFPFLEREILRKILILKDRGRGGLYSLKRTSDYHRQHVLQLELLIHHGRSWRMQRKPKLKLKLLKWLVWDSVPDF
jgi:hypothetical protein